jgi:hypothetical protein
MTDSTNWCAGALPGGAPAHQAPTNGLKALAIKALRELEHAPATRHIETAGALDQRCNGASGALGAGGALGAQNDTRALLATFAKRIGVPTAVVDNLPTEELDATAEQLALCKGHLDRDGNPLARSLLTFYLHALADQSTPRTA